MPPIDYLNPAVPAGLRRVTMPVVDATDANLAGFGRLVDAPDGCPIEIVRWPAQGWRPVDADTGDEGGTTRRCLRQRMARRHPLRPQRSRRRSLRAGVRDGTFAAPTRPMHAIRDRMLLWHVNYHPDGGQLFFPLECAPFLRAAGACPATTCKPEAFVCFRFDGTPRSLHPPERLARRRVRARAARSVSSTSKAPSTRACRSTSRASSAACSRPFSRESVSDADSSTSIHAASRLARSASVSAAGLRPSTIDSSSRQRR